MTHKARRTLTAPMEIPASWTLLARCTDLPVDWFVGKDDADTEAAQRVCALCPVQAACRRYAVDHPEIRGIWGGLTDDARERLRNQRELLLAS